MASGPVPVILAQQHADGYWLQPGYWPKYNGTLQTLDVLTALGYGANPRLANGLKLLLGKQDARGHWPLEYTYTGKTWIDVEQKGRPSKWVTLRALRVLQRCGDAQGTGTIMENV